MKKKLLMMVTVAGLLGFNCDAQLGQNVTNAATGTISENATVAGGNIFSPDLFSGTVNVNIPIYSYSVDGLDLGVSLTYNTGGIKVDQVASNVGLGWNLSIGGMITRETHGIEDELTEVEIDTGSVPTGYKLFQPEERGAWVEDNYTNTNNAVQDKEPDVFTAVFGGRMIKFSIGNYSGGANHVYVTPNKNIQVEVFMDTALVQGLQYGQVPDTMDEDNFDPPEMISFKITDEQGNQFFFSRGDYQIRDVNLIFPSGVGWRTNQLFYFVPSSWYLDRVITYTGQMVTYTYADDYIWYPGYMDQQVIETSNFKWALVYNDSTNYPGSMTATDSTVQLSEFIHRIKQINYPNGDIVTFDTDGNMRSDVGGDDYEPNNDAITGVTVYKGYDATVNNSFTYKFNYGYFNATGGATTYPTNSTISPMYNLRLKLLGISKTGTDGTTTENYYTFGYVGDNAGENQLPARLSGENDCYGYYNSSSISFTSSILPTSEESAYNSLLTTLGKVSVPPHTFSFTNSGGTNISITYGRDQTPNWAYAAAGTLETVTNGTGGNVKFYYQSHNLSNPPDFNSTPVNTGYYDDNNMYSFKSSYGPNPNLLYTTANDGVCIDSIVTSDGFNPDNNTKTIYTFNGGMRFFVGGFFWYPTITNQLFLHYHSTPGMPGVSATPGDDQTVVLGKLYQNTFVNPIEYVNGFNHGYSNAVVQTYGYNNTLLKTEKYGFTNIMTQSGEGTYAGSTTTVTPLPVGSCRIRFPYFGMYGQTFMPECFEQQYLGLLKTDTVLDNTGDILSITANTYAENRSSDSLTGLEQRFYFGVGSFSSGVADSIYAWFRTGAYIEAGAEADTAYNRPSSVVDLVSSTTTNYSGTTSLPVASVYVYDANDNLVETGYNDSKGHREGEVNSYTTNTYSMTYGASGPGGSGGTLTHTVQNLTWKYKEVSYDGTNWNLQSSSALNGYFDNTHSTSGYGITVTGMLRCNSVVNMFANYVVSLGTSPPSLSGSYMIKAKDFLVYDDHNNVVETAYNNDEDTSSAIWDNRIGEKVAQVNNAAYNDIAYTSFEGGISFLTGFDYNKGNWTFSPGQIIAGSTITGRYYYDLDGYPVTSLNTLTSGKQYILSFWYNNTYAVPNFSIPGTINDSSTNRLTAGSWTLATIRFTATSAGYVSVSTTTSGVRIDELRLMPASASMDTYTYEPLLGVSSHCDERNNITYYEYDAMGRLHVVKDINGNVISMTRNVVQGSDGY